MARTTFYGRKIMQVNIQPNIGLDASVRESVIEMLNLILADQAVLSQKTRRADGHVSGVNVPELQPLYDIQYKQMIAISKKIVERVQILGGSQLSGPEELIDSARLGGELNAVSDIVSILADHEAFLRFLREDARKCSEMYEDQGTFALLVSVIQVHEKMAWILRSNIASGQFNGDKGETNANGSGFMD
jgi:starvation-inducible DNA-binding protein